MAGPRTFQIKSPYMQGDDIREWQKLVKGIARSWDVHLPLKVDGVYGLQTRSFSKTIGFARGFTHAQLEEGITPWVRTHMRDPNEAMDERRAGRWRKGFRDDLRQKYPPEVVEPDVAAPIGKIITMTWGWHPGVHDGIDLICGANAPIYAICDAKVVDVRAGGWWGKSPTGDVWKGDGIIQIESRTDVGPFSKGMHFGYGHAEGANVKVGDLVDAGDRLGEAGLANAWHIHFMANGGGHLRGIGDRDPEPFVRYAQQND